MFEIYRLSITSIFILALCAGCGGDSDDGGENPTNSAPVFTSANSATVEENQTSTGYTASATDDDGDNISYSIVGGADAALFNIDETSGDLSFISAPAFDDPDDSDADNVYEVELQASDGTDPTVLAVTITVTEAPELIDPESNNYLARIPFACSDQETMVANTTDEFPDVTAVSAEEFLETGVLLGRPTSTSISVSILPVDDISNVQVAYATTEIDLEQGSGIETNEVDIDACDTYVAELTELAPSTQYYYQISYTDGEGDQVSNVGRFHTARATGESFSFAVHADPHLGSLFRFDVTLRHPSLSQQNENATEEMYAVTMANTLASGADFMIDLGDTFMTEKNENRGLYAAQYEAYDAAGGAGSARDYPMSEEELIGDYAYFRSLFAQVGHSLPVFLTVGNHEVEVEKYISDNANPDYTPAIWGNAARKNQFPVPTACDHESFDNNGFYSGMTDPDVNLTDNVVGNNCHDSYYAWQWGDALFIVIDPLWQQMDLGNAAPQAWEKSIGLEQYQWLTETLEENTAVPFKFVFMHNMVGGLRNVSGSERGGALLANYYEWGGCTEKWDEVYPDLTEDELYELIHPEDFDVDGSCTSEFDIYREGWEKPIQDLLLEHNVQIVFKGHDHIYVREQHPNGMVYQTVPQPSIYNNNLSGVLSRAANYHYDTTNTAAPSVDTVVDSSSGFLLVTVNAGEVDGNQTTSVEYRKTVPNISCLDGSNACYSVDSDVVSSYSIDATSNLYTPDSD